ncbi:carbon monoxide dehydrogenase [Methylobacterium sp. Leaf93]|nr:carbon monoxide dehydrogenase [Methylobacterium sp. Leaf93]
MTSMPEKSTPPRRLTSEEQQRQRRRSIAIATVLFVLVAIFYALTIAKLGPQILNRPL